MVWKLLTDKVSLQFLFFVVAWLISFNFYAQTLINLSKTDHMMHEERSDSVVALGKDNNLWQSFL